MIVLLAGAILGPAAAQTTPVATDRGSELQAAFRSSMAKPADAALALRYAQLAAAQGQLRSAINALERALRYNPGLDTLRLELASLYNASGAPGMVGVYAPAALAAPDIPPDVAARGRQLLAGAERASARSLLTGNLFVGARYDSNANQATTLGTISAFNPFLGSIQEVTASNRGRSDASLVVTGSLSHRYDLGLQREGTWESNLSAFRQDFAQLPHAYDLSVLQFDSGPRIGVADIGGGTLAVRPFVAASYLAYGNRSLAWLVGGGMSAELRLPPRWTVELSAQGRQGEYYASSFRPTLGLYSGPEYTFSLTGTYAISPASRVGATVFYYNASASADYYSRSGPGASLTAASDFALLGRTVGASVRAGVRRLGYGGGDPQINPFTKRDDVIFDAGASLLVPLTSYLSAVAQYDYAKQNSNYDALKFSNHAVTLGLRLGF